MPGAEGADEGRRKAHERENEMNDMKALTECAECTWDYIDRLRMALAAACKERDEARKQLHEAKSELDKYRKAEQDGRLVVLPAKTVFELTWDAGPECDIVCPVSINGEGCCDFCDKGKLFVYERTCTQELLKELGKTVFLTREEAEAALAGKGGEG